MSEVNFGEKILGHVMVLTTPAVAVQLCMTHFMMPSQKGERHKGMLAYISAWQLSLVMNHRSIYTYSEDDDSGSFLPPHLNINTKPSHQGQSL